MDVKAKSDQRGTECLSEQARGGNDPTGAAAAFGRCASHQRFEIGRLKKAESGAA